VRGGIPVHENEICVLALRDGTKRPRSMTAGGRKRQFNRAAELRRHLTVDVAGRTGTIDPELPDDFLDSGRPMS